MMSCKETTRLISEDLDQPLPWSKRVAVRMHVLLCRRCAAYRRQLRAITNLLRVARSRAHSMPTHTGPGLTDEARDRIKKSLQDRQQNSA